MVAFRNRHRSDDGPVATPPTNAASLPPKSDAPEPAPINEPSPVEEAKQTAIQSELKQRLAEMERAEELSSSPRLAPAPPPQPEIPASVGEWLDKHPEYLQDPEKNAALQFHHYSAVRETGEEFTPRYMESLERHLGLRQRPQPNGNGHQPAPRREAPAPQRQQYSGGPVSAPPSREIPLMSTGRPPSFRAPLTKEEVDFARSLGQTPEEYARQKEKMLQMKAAGEIQDGR